ncbi:MAG: caspase family protein [Methanothrix sp.]|uniref:caspase family protein n=1 Tax=Methanothrix sp. TaxID=90426 RepID=UPI0032AFE1D8|nr:caspase family protein [Methanothrix sp.]
MKQLLLLISVMILLILAPAVQGLEGLSKLYAYSDESKPDITPRVPSDQAWDALNALSSYSEINYSYVPSRSRSFEVLEQIASQYSNEDPILKSRSSIGSSISYLYSRNVEPPALPYAKDANARYTYINTGQGSSFYRRVGHQMSAEYQSSAENPSVSYEKSSQSIRSLYTSAEERRLPGVSRSRTEEDLMALSGTDDQEHTPEMKSVAVRSHVSTSLNHLRSSNSIEQQKIAPDFESYKYDKRNSERKYAVVVGINSYQDRPSLRASVNDAEAFATLLKSYGYEVIEITDRSDTKPTKGNILEKGLGALRSKKGASKIVFYFSGHGETRYGRYYLIPQDANGDPSSFIDIDEIYRYTKDLKNLVIIVDACGSANLEKIIMPGQVMLASSRENEASNEAWFGSLSVFTESLLAAMREDERFYGEISLQRCFYRAQERTEGWTRMRLMSQRPSYRAAGDFYLA